MIFLIEYNRREGKIVTVREFEDLRQREAEEMRLHIELELNREGKGHEVALFEADNLEALRRTHLRYFADLTQMLEAAGGRDVEAEH